MTSTPALAALLFPMLGTPVPSGNTETGAASEGLEFLSVLREMEPVSEEWSATAEGETEEPHKEETPDAGNIACAVPLLPAAQVAAPLLSRGAFGLSWRVSQSEGAAETQGPVEDVEAPELSTEGRPTEPPAELPVLPVLPELPELPEGPPPVGTVPVIVAPTTEPVRLVQAPEAPKPVEEETPFTPVPAIDSHRTAPVERKSTRRHQVEDEPAPLLKDAPAAAPPPPLPTPVIEPPARSETIEPPDQQPQPRKAIDDALPRATPSIPPAPAAPPAPLAFAVRATLHETAAVAAPAAPAKTQSAPAAPVALPPPAPVEAPAPNDSRPDSGSNRERREREPAAKTVVKDAQPAYERPAAPAEPDLSVRHPVIQASAIETRTTSENLPRRPVETRAASVQAMPVPVEDKAQPSAPAAREISLRVAGDDDQRVELRVVQRAGEVRVSVHSPDEALTRNLRSNLSELTAELGQSGYRAESWRPAEGGAHQPNEERAGTPGQGRDGGREQKQSNGNQGQRQNSQEEGSRKRPAWLDEFETHQAASRPTRRDR